MLNKKQYTASLRWLDLSVGGFQKEYGLTVDKIYGKKTDAKLQSVVKSYKKKLSKLTGVKVDNNALVGKGTKKATIKAQKMYKLKADGICGSKTRAKVNSEYKKKFPSSSSEKKTKYSKYLIYINPGHGASDPGACRYSGGKLIAKEKDMALSTAKYLNSYLKAEGFKTGMTRSGDSEITLVQRASKANRAKADLYISIHFNAGGGDGLELIVHPSSSKGLKLAKHLKDHICKETGQNFRRYIKRADYDVRGTNMPAVIIEGAFMDNTKDFSLISTADKRKKLAKSYCNGIKSYVDSL